MSCERTDSTPGGVAGAGELDGQLKGRARACEYDRESAGRAGTGAGMAGAAARPVAHRDADVDESAGRGPAHHGGGGMGLGNRHPVPPGRTGYGFVCGDGAGRAPGHLPLAGPLPAPLANRFQRGRAMARGEGALWALRCWPRCCSPGPADLPESAPCCFRSWRWSRRCIWCWRGWPDCSPRTLRMRAHSEPNDRRVLVIGSGDAARALVWQTQNVRTGYRVVGMVDDDPQQRGDRVLGVPVLGCCGQVPSWRRACGYSRSWSRFPRCPRNGCGKSSPSARPHGYPCVSCRGCAN